MNIVITVDDNYLQHAAVMTASLNKTLTSQAHIYLVHGGINKTNLSKFFRHIDNCEKLFVTEIFINDDSLSDFPLSHHGVIASYYRLLLPDILDVDEIIYIDPDIIVCSDLNDAELQITDETFVLAVEAHQNDKERLGFTPDTPYFGSGFMVINLKKWKTEGIHKNAQQFVRDKPNSIRWWDQDALNAVLVNKWTPIHPKWNVYGGVLYGNNEMFLCYNQQQLDDAKKNPSIIHYTGSSKPWHYLNEHPYKQLYWDYLATTPWADYVQNDLTIINWVKKRIPQWLRTAIGKIIKS